MSMAVTIALAIWLVCISTLDYRYLRLPNFLTLPLIAGGLVWSSIAQGVEGLQASAGASLFAYASISFLRSLPGALRNGIGMGDAKLLAGVGAWLGLSYLAPVLLVSATLGLTYAGALRLVGREIRRTSLIPFGPFLCIAFFVFWCVANAGSLVG
ncbi:MAG: A24 family peptidase [Fimbriimonadaceae bacterium]